MQHIHSSLYDAPKSIHHSDTVTRIASTNAQPQTPHASKTSEGRGV